jgi:hypothetical protein
MKASSNENGKIYEILLFEQIEGASEPPFFSSDVFAIKDMPGVWRRVKRSQQGLKTDRRGAVLGMWNTQIVELVRDPKLEAELVVAGFKLDPSVGPAVPPPPPDETPEGIFNAQEAFNQERMKQAAMADSRERDVQQGEAAF